MESIIWEAQAAMLAIRLAIQHLQLAPYILGNSLLTVLAINKGYLFNEWSCTPIIFDIHPQLPFFSKWTTFKIIRYMWQYFKESHNLFYAFRVIQSDTCTATIIFLHS